MICERSPNAPSTPSSSTHLREPPSGRRHHGGARRPSHGYRARCPRLDGIDPGPPGPGRLGPEGPGRRLARRLGSGAGRAGERLARWRPAPRHGAGPTWPASTRPGPSAPPWGLGPTTSTAWCRLPSSWPVAGGYRSTTAGTVPHLGARPRPVRHHDPPDHRRQHGPPHRRGPLPRRPAHPSHRRPAGILARILAAGAQGDGRPLPQTRLARKPGQRSAGAPPTLTGGIALRWSPRRRRGDPGNGRPCGMTARGLVDSPVLAKAGSGPSRRWP